MKIVATIEENNPVNVKRYENDVLVGEREVSVKDYCYSLASELPVGAFIKHLLDSASEVSDYLRYLSDFKDFSKFISMFLTNVDPRWYADDESVITMVNSFIGRLGDVNPNTPDVAVLVNNLVKHLPSIEMNTPYYKLFLEMLKKIVTTKDENLEPIVRMAVYSSIVQQLKNEDIEVVKTTITNIIPHLDNTWFSSMVLEAQKVSTNPITYYSGKMPSKVNYVSVNSRRTSFVYDIPKQLVETTYQASKIGKIGYPRLLCIYTLSSEGTVNSMRIFAAKEGDILNDSMDIYEYPYSHVFESGKVCWNYSDITIDMLPYAHELFLAGNNLNHNRPNAFELFMEQKDKNYEDEKLKFIGKLGNVL